MSRNQIFREHDQRGNIALEYIIISAFSAVIAVAAINYVGKIVREKTEKIEKALGIELEDIPEPDF